MNQRGQGWVCGLDRRRLRIASQSLGSGSSGSLVCISSTLLMPYFPVWAIAYIILGILVVYGLSGNNSFTGPANIMGGALHGSAAALSGPVVLANNANVTFDQSSATGTYAQAISGSGSFTKTGNNTLCLVGLDTYTGPTQINGGTLKLGFGGGTGGPFANVPRRPASRRFTSCPSRAR